MKIVHVAEWNELSGGAYTVVNNLIAHSLEHNPKLDIHVVSFGSENKEIVMNGYTVHLVKSTFFPTSKYWYSHKSLKIKILQLDPDLVHLHFTYPPYSLLTNLPFPVVITAHGLTSRKAIRSHAIRTYFNLSFIFEPIFEKKALKKATSIIAVSNWMKSKIELIIGRNEKVVFIPNGINPLCFKSNKPEPQLLNHPAILYAGRLIKLKGVDVLVSSFYELQKQIPGVHLYIAGDGPQLSSLKKQAKKLGIENNVCFLGFLPKEKLRYFMLEADYFVVPSRYESFGIVVLEAMDCGLPIIASNSGGLSEILNHGEYGILFESENAKDLTEKILFLFQNSSQVQKLSDNGKLRVNDFLWVDISKKTLDLYSSLIKE